MSTPVSSLVHPKYRPDIDGLRAVAVMAVVAYHAFPLTVKGGFIGVDIFFVISGYLISKIIFESFEKSTFSFSEFFSRRVRRIFPALLIVFIMSLLFGGFTLLSDELNLIGKHIAAGAGFVSNLVLWSESGYFEGSAETKPLLHLWSLGIEEQFYIVWPPIVWLAWKFRLNIIFLTLFMACASFGLNIWHVNHDVVGAFYSPFSRFWELLFGAVLAYFSMKRGLSSPKGSSGKSPISFGDKLKLPIKEEMISNLCSLLGTAFLIFGFLNIHKDVIFPGYWALVPVTAAVLLIVAGPHSWLNRYILSNKILVWIGLISFPLYLWHWPILAFGRLVYFDLPPLEFRIGAIGVSILLAWLTMRFIERPFRWNHENSRINVFRLSLSLICFGVIGLSVYNTDFTQSRSYSQLRLKRTGGEHIIGSSNNWFEGKEGWLFLGNAHEHSVAKLKLAGTPSEEHVEWTQQAFSAISDAAFQHGAKAIFVLGPDKPSIYPEYLPEEITPSPTKYSSFFLEAFKKTPHLSVYDPTQDLLYAKNTEGLLYLKTDTHWNNKGAYLTFLGFSKILNVPIPEVSFQQGVPKAGDLLKMARFKTMPSHPQDTWDVVWATPPEWSEKKSSSGKKSSFGYPSLVKNHKPTSQQYVWIIGDSFTEALRQYFNATFAQVRYVGHWVHTLHSLPNMIHSAQKKPDLIVIIRVERSF